MKMQLDFKAALLTILFFFTLVSCTKQIRPNLPTATEAVKRDASLAELLHLYKQNLKTRRTLKALIEIKADLGKRGKHDFQSSWRSEKNRIKMKGFNLFGGTLFDLELNGSGFSIHIPSERKVFEGDLEFFEDMAGEKIPFGSLGLLEWVKRGGIPEVGPDLIPALEKRDHAFILYIFSTESGRGILKEKVWIERTAFRVERVEFFDHEGRQKSIAIFKDYREVKDQIFPFSITGKHRGQVLELNFKEVSFPLNPFSSGKKSK